MQVLSGKIGINESSTLCINKTFESLTLFQYVIRWNFSTCVGIYRMNT